MEQESTYVGIDVAKAQVDVAVRPTGQRWAVSYDESGGGILKKCVNGQAVYPLSEQEGLKAQERRYTAYGKEKH